MIHVLIERHIADGMLSTYEQITRVGLQKSYISHGFISGEAFSNTNDIHHRFVLCKWRSQDDWDSWYHSKERDELMASISAVLTAPEKVFILEH